jgi:hypothetical protein
MFGPYVHFCLDIETANGEPTEIERWARLEWSPSPTWKPATIGERYLQILESKKAKLALLEGAPIIAVAIQTDRDLRCLHSMKPQAATVVGQGVVEGYSTEREMLVALRATLETCCTAETVLIGHNIRGFDLPKLRGAFVRAGLRLPAQLAAPDQPFFDSMVEYRYRFRGANESIFISAADLMDAFRIQHHKAAIGGEQIPELFWQGKFDEIAAYALLDAQKEYELFLRMTGQLSADDPVPVNGNATASSPLAKTLQACVATELQKQIQGAASLIDLVRARRSIADARPQLSDADQDRLNQAYERREGELIAGVPDASAPSLKLVTSGGNKDLKF